MSIKQRLLAGALCLSAALMAGPALAAEVTEGYFTANDGARIHYMEAGTGKPLVLIPGWSQTAAQFKHQLEGLSDRYHVIALDMRGHGESDKPTTATASIACPRTCTSSWPPRTSPTSPWRATPWAAR